MTRSPTRLLTGRNRVCWSISWNVSLPRSAVPGRPAPKIITTAMVDGMKPGSVIVDLAAETGGNCEATVPGQTIDHGGVVVSGPLNLASMGAVHASEMYANLLSGVSATQFGE